MASGQGPGTYPAYLVVPQTWPGGARRIKCRVSYSSTRIIDGVYYIWCVITQRTDPHRHYGERFFAPEHLIERRDR